MILPNNWEARPHQQKLWRYLERGGKRAVEIAHRRWGKDDVALHHTAAALTERVGGYWHCLPEFAQAKKAIWTAVNPHTGKRRIDEAFPKEMRLSTNEHEMFIRFKNGSTWQVIGSDNYDTLVGASIAGMVFSEWARANPAAWAYFSPILVENDGWALFITTPIGRNHAKTIYDLARKTPGWFAELSPVDQTGVVSDVVVEAARAEYHAIYGQDIGDALIDQEWFCSFEAAILGSYWGRDMVLAEQEGRITQVAADPNEKVHTAWDLGVGDSTALWFFQMAGEEIHVIDYEEGSNLSIQGWKAIKDQRGYNYGFDYVPHDAKQRSFTAGRQDGTAKQRIEVMLECGLKPILVPNHAVIDGINAARQTIKRCWFDEVRCAKGLECLRQYQREWDDDKKVFKKTPMHNWASHGADAFRYLSMAWKLKTVVAEQPADQRTLDPLQRAKELGKRPKVLQEMTYDEFQATRPQSREGRI